MVSHRNVARAVPGAFNPTKFVQIGLPPPGDAFVRSLKPKNQSPTSNEAGHPCASEPLPMNMEEAIRRGWDEIDIVFVTGDAYIDHPSFAMAILGRVLEACGFRVGVVAQPDWHSCDGWKTFGRPKLFFAINMPDHGCTHLPTITNQIFSFYYV